MKEGENTVERYIRDDRMLFSSIVKHIAQAAPNEDPSDFILASIGQSVGADRCYVYRFWNPGKSSMCTNTHEWCAEGIKPEIGGQQTCNLADLVEFNAHIMSGRDFFFTDINAIDSGSREWLAPQGIQSLIVTPLVGANNTICGFAGFDFVKAPCKEFTERIVFNIHQAADLLLNCQRMHEHGLARRDIPQQEDEHQKYDLDFERALAALHGDVHTMRPAQMLEIVRKSLDADFCDIMRDIRPEGGGTIFAGHALTRDGVTNTRDLAINQKAARALNMRLLTSSVVTLRESEISWLEENIEAEDLMSDLAGKLKTLHFTGVHQDGKLVGIMCAGFVADDHPLTPLQIGFLRRSAFVIVSALERISTYHELSVALNVANLKAEVVEFIFKHEDYTEIMEFLGSKVCAITGAQHLMLSSDDGSRSDWFGADAPECCRNCVKASTCAGKQLPQDFLADRETMIFLDGDPLPDMNRPPYCPMTSAAVAQFKKGAGWWRLVADYTHPHKHNMDMVARGLRTALEFLAIAYDRECREKTIKQMQVHQQFRADALAYALSRDNLPGLIDLTLHRLLELTACDYIAIHSVDGDHKMLYPGEKLKTCPGRCEACSFYKLTIPPVEDADHVIELNDTKHQAITSLPTECPAKSLEVIIVYCEGKPWGGIALHYTNRQHRISENDRQTLKIAANVLTLALERHAAAVRLKTEHDRVVEAEKTRSYFFSAVSHDIRTPLNAIIGFSELLQAGDVPPEEAKQNLDMIVSSSKMLLQLVDDVLDLSKMDLGKLNFNHEPTDVGELLREAVLAFRPMMAKKGQTFVLEIADMPRLMVDSFRFRQMMFNYINNAVKYAGPCTIRITSTYEDGRLKLTVADNGKGVSPDKAKRLMQPFVQADIKNRTEGSGLGLAICKRLVELAHGTLAIDTAPGKGFVIHVKVPIDLAPEEQASDKVGALSTIEVSHLPKRILLVDDSPVNRAVLKAMLKKINITDIELAEDGKVALDKLKRDPTFDLVMSDMWMPVMDGAELVKRIRADERLAKLKVCSITADVESCTTYREKGFDSLLLKPVTIKKLMDLFAGARFQN
ncbi:MAG: response regulator [Kiritimatiellae bacterium]|nr:response regulator [Kiritimatiellia bacterium]